MEVKKYASTIPACGMIIAILIFAQIPIMFGQSDTNAIIYALPWLLSAFPVLLLCIAFMFKNGELVDGTINAVLSGVLMGQNFVRGIIALTMYNNGVKVTPELMMSSYAIDKWVYLAGGIILLFACWLAHFNSKMATLGILAGAIGFLALSAMYAGFSSVFGVVGAVGLVILGVYLLYSAIAVLINTAMEKTVLPVK